MDFPAWLTTTATGTTIGRSSGPELAAERHQDALVTAIAEADGLPADDQRCRLVAAFALQALTAALRSADPSRTVDLGFALIEHGRQAT